MRSPCRDLCCRCSYILASEDNLASGETAAALKCYRTKPRLRRLVVAFNVNMWWLVSITRIEKEPIRYRSQDGWHAPASLQQAEIMVLVQRLSRNTPNGRPAAERPRFLAARSSRLFARVTDGRILHHTVMPKTKVTLTLDTALVEEVDELVAGLRFRSRSQAIEAALSDKLQRLARTRLARESAKLNPREEKRLAEDGLIDALESWPEY